METEPYESRGLPIYCGPDFVRAYSPLAQVVEGLLSRGAVIAMTGRTGDGKTALATLLEVALATDRPFAGRDVEAGQVIVLCGENPEDYRVRLLATMEALDLTPPDLKNIFVIPSTFDIPHELPRLQELANTLSNLVAVVVDTSAAYFQSGDENDNVSMRAHAAGLRRLTTLKGTPVVLALCHPTKNPTQDNLLPRGGGAFLAEVDGNMTVWRAPTGMVTLHWTGKLRGQPFDPIYFQLAPWKLRAARYPNGKPVAAVVACFMPEDEAERIEARESDDARRLLCAMVDNPNASFAELAQSCGFLSAEKRDPQKSRIHRMLADLKTEGLVGKRSGKWTVTKTGKATAAQWRAMPNSA